MGSSFSLFGMNQVGIYITYVMSCHVRVGMNICQGRYVYVYVYVYDKEKMNPQRDSNR